MAYNKISNRTKEKDINYLILMALMFNLIYCNKLSESLIKI